MPSERTERNSNRTIEETFLSRALPLYFIPYRNLVNPRTPKAWWLEHLSLLFLATWPVFALLSGDAGTAHAWRIATLLLVDYLILECILAAWRKYALAAGAMDALLRCHADEAKSLAHHLGQTMLPWKQAICCALSATSFSLVVFLPKHPLALPSTFAVLTCINTGLLVGQALYLNIGTLLLARQIRDAHALPVNKLRPRQSQGIAQLSRAVQVHAKAGLILIAVVMIPITVGYLKGKSIHELVILLAMASLGPLSVVAIGVTAQLWIYEPADRQEEKSLLAILTSLEQSFDSVVSVRPAVKDRAQIEMQLQFLKNLEEGEPSAFGKGTVLQYIAIGIPILLQVAVALVKYVR